MNRTPIKIYIRILASLLIISLIGFFLIINKLDPTGNSFNIFLFYLDLFLIVLSVTALAAFYLRLWLGQREFTGMYFAVSFRQGVWFGILVTTSFALQAFGFFSLVNAILLACALVFLESYFLYNK